MRGNQFLPMTFENRLKHRRFFHLCGLFQLRPGSNLSGRGDSAPLTCGSYPTKTMSISTSFKLNTGDSIPAIGLGEVGSAMRGYSR